MVVKSSFGKSREFCVYIWDDLEIVCEDETVYQRWPAGSFAQGAQLIREIESHWSSRRRLFQHTYVYFAAKTDAALYINK